MPLGVSDILRVRCLYVILCLLVEACGNMEHMQVVLREETAHRTCYELVGQNYEELGIANLQWCV